MKKIDKKINVVFDHINEITGNSSDVTTRVIKIAQKKVGYIYLESVSSDDKISDFLVRSLTIDARETNFNLFNEIFEKLQNTITNSKMKTANTYEDLFYYITPQLWSKQGQN